LDPHDGRNGRLLPAALEHSEHLATGCEQQVVERRTVRLVETAALQIELEEDGPPDGWPLLLLHGWPDAPSRSRPTRSTCSTPSASTASWS
jgi:hypothetical protein